MKVMGQEDFNQICKQARDHSRRRKNYNVHPQLSDPVQRLFNAIEPYSYVQPHRHCGTDAWETFVLIQGEAVVLIFDDDGTILHRAHLTLADIRMVEIPTNAYHTLFALESGTLLFEIKRGPYDPNQAKDFASWAPPEGEDESRVCATWFEVRRQETGMCEAIFDRSYSPRIASF